MLNDQYAMLPGIGDTLNTVAKQVWWGKEEQQQAMQGVLVSTAVDAGDTPTTLLRPGLLLGCVNATGKLKEWNPTGTDGSERIYGVLLTDISTLYAGVAADHYMAWVLVKGNLIASALLIPGETTYGISGKNAELRVRNQLNGRFLFDDKPWEAGGIGAVGQLRIKVVESTDPKLAAGTYTMDIEDNHTWFITDTGAAITFALPQLAGQLRHGFHCRFSNGQGFNMLVTTGVVSDDSIIAFNDAAADSIAFQQANELIGGSVEVLGYYDGAAAKWMALPYRWEAQTNVVA